MAVKPKAADAGPFMPAIIVDPQAGAPQFRQLYEGLARAIREGQFAPGSRLPSGPAPSRSIWASPATPHIWPSNN
jgi:hypothetical protein